MTTNQGCKSLVPIAAVDSRYFAYMLSVCTPELNSYGRGSTFLELSSEALGAFRVPFPPLEEQAAIGAFLDVELGKIDALVAEQRRLLELLKEKRQAIISHTVTRGLDPNAPMKASGARSIGSIPSHWEVKRLKHLSPGLTVGIVVEPSKLYADDGVPALRSLNVRAGEISTEDVVYITEEGNRLHSKSQLNAGDLVVVRTGQPGAAAIVPAELEGCNCIDLIVVRRPPHASVEFLCWYMASDSAISQVALGSGGAIQQHFNIGTAKQLAVCLPPREEQEQIAEYVRVETKRIDDLMTDSEGAIALLQERRAALISAAVTGQIDVRGLAEKAAA